MKTFDEWLYAEAYDPLSITNIRIDQYLKYALREMQKQLHPPISMPYDPSMQFAIDQAHNQGYYKGLSVGKREGKKIGSGYGSLNLGERAIKNDEYDRLKKFETQNFSAYDRGYKNGVDQSHYERGFDHGFIQGENTPPKAAYKKELAAARECAMTLCIKDSVAEEAVYKLRQALGIDFLEVYNKNRVKL